MIKALTLPILLLAMMAPVTSALAQDAVAGEKKAAMCIGCHGIPGYQASFPEVYRVPQISGQNGKYIAAALAAYKKGERKHPSMRAIAGSMSDQDMADLAAYYEKHGTSAVKAVADLPHSKPDAHVEALLAKGACASCHGPNFNKPIDGAYPKLAGQPADYLYFAMKAYRVEGNPQVGRANAIMSAQVKSFKLAELKAMAAYLSSLPGDTQTLAQAKFR